LLSHYLPLLTSPPLTYKSDWRDHLLSCVSFTRRVNILLSLCLLVRISPIMTTKDHTHPAENHPADPSTLSSSASVNASIATPRSWRSTPGRILSRLLPSWLGGGASTQSVSEFMLLDAEPSDTKEGCSNEEQEEAEQPKKLGKTPHNANKSRGDPETHCEVGPYHSGYRGIRMDRHRREMVGRTTNRRDNDGDDNRAAAPAVRHIWTSGREVGGTR
jgi:hypothetical protein